MKYLVMECHGKYAVLLDEEAGFVKAANMSYAVGQTVENPKLIRSTAVQSRIIMRVTAGFGAVAACAAVIIGIGRYQEYYVPYSSVTMSINPDVKMELNRHGEVLSLVGLNEDGITLIEGVDPERKDKAVVSDILIERAVELGFLSEGGRVVFEIDIPDETMYQNYSEELKEETHSVLSGLRNVEIVVRHPGESDYDVQEETYDDIVIPIPAQTQRTTVTAPSGNTQQNVVQPAEPSGGGDSAYNDNAYGDRVYEETSAAPVVTAPPVITAAPVYNDSAYGDSAYGDSLYG